MEATARLDGQRRSLLPREHGAYAELGLPLGTAFLVTAVAIVAALRLG